MGLLKRTHMESHMGRLDCFVGVLLGHLSHLCDQSWK